MRCLYFDCFSGASGNMILGALIDLGVNEQLLISSLKSLGIDGFKIEVSRCDRSGISAAYVDVQVPDRKKHRHLEEIEAIIQNSGLSDLTKQRARSIFRRLAEAEAKIHGVAVEKVHFHEVGALDAIIDIVGACIGFEILGIERFFCSPINLGSGFVEMSHGRFPVPAPATAELLREAVVYSSGVEGELITPTGAAIISTVCQDFGTFPKMKLRKIAYGAGSMNFKRYPNVLRVLLGTLESEDLIDETLTLLETNVDDVSPQVFGFLMERAFEMGALDCWFTPIHMKKNRPAVSISVLCRESDKPRFCEMLFKETGTLGVRVTNVRRESTYRESITFNSKYGMIKLKKSTFKGEILNIKPEYDDLRSIARRFNKSMRELEAEILKDFEKDEVQREKGRSGKDS